jgi:hypothetical protein
VRRAAALALTIALGWAPPAAGQDADTRGEQLRRERETKAQTLTPYRPNFLERTLIALENDRLLERVLNPAEGLYPKLGTVTPGSGFSLGPAYRRPGLLGGHADFSAFASGSSRKYWMLDARLALPRLFDGAAFAQAAVQRYDFPSEDFFGLGPASLRTDHVTYGFRSTVVGATTGVRPAAWLSLGGGVEYLTPRVDAGEDDRSIEQLFDAATAPGLDGQPDFVRGVAFVEVNSRMPRGNPRRGGRYALSIARYDDRGSGRYSFRRIDADVQQYISLLRERRVLALHGRLSLSDPAGGLEVPFYFQPTLGGPDDLRGFRRFRFRDRHALLLQAEYRWEIFTAVDGAIFYDAGTVASRREDLRLDGLESDYGIGFRFGTANGVFLRVEGAFGSRGGKHFVFRFGHVF